MDPRNWTVTLKQPAVVHDVLRHPVEGGIPASDKEAERLFNNDLLTEDPQPIPQPGDGDEADEIPEDLEGLKVADLKAKALKDGVPLNDATTKADIIAAFVAHRTKEA